MPSISKFILLFSILVSSNALGRDLPCHEQNWLDANKSLLIRDLSVVNDGRARHDGPWSFAAAMTAALGSSRDIGRKTYSWLDQFGSLTELNGFPLRPRTPGHLLENWPRVGAPPGEIGSGTNLDLSRAPFRLLAIVFRTDLSSLEKPAGEGRMIFGATNPTTDVKQLTVIFEFELPVGIMTRRGQLTSHEFWLRATAGLSTIPMGSQFQQELQFLTDIYLGDTGRRSYISQVRTNEQYFGPGWDLREFHIDRQRGVLMQAPVEQTPDISLNTRENTELVGWINSHRTSILENSYQLPERFLGASAFLDDDRFGWFLQNPNIEPDVRRAFANNTCNGCHGRETRSRFQHVEPRSAGQVSAVSDYLQRELGIRAQLLTQSVCESP